jgi:hypothetical protein
MYIYLSIYPSIYPLSTVILHNLLVVVAFCNAKSQCMHFAWHVISFCLSSCTYLLLYRFLGDRLSSSHLCGDNFLSQLMHRFGFITNDWIYIKVSTIFVLWNKLCQPERAWTILLNSWDGIVRANSILWKLLQTKTRLILIDFRWFMLVSVLFSFIRSCSICVVLRLDRQHIFKYLNPSSSLCLLNMDSKFYTFNKSKSNYLGIETRILKSCCSDARLF